MASRSEIEALLHLWFDDPDEDIQQSVRLRFMQLGEDAVPLLDEMHIYQKDDAKRLKMADLIHELTLQPLEEEFFSFIQQGVGDLEALEEALFYVARFGKPTLRTELYIRKLDELAERIADDLAFLASHGEKLRLFLTYLFKEEHFSGDQQHYLNPANSYINQVIDRRKGIPLSLALIALFVGRRLKLPLQGVNMPMHFLLSYQTGDGFFYVDPFQGGSILRLEQCKAFLIQNGVEPKPEHFSEATPKDMLIRSIRNLIIAYQKMGLHNRGQQLERWIAMLESVHNH